MTDITEMASVVGVSPDLIQIEVSSTDEYAQLDSQLEIGSYLRISDDDDSAVVAVVQSYRIKDRLSGDGTEITSPTFVIDSQPVGRLVGEVFRRGGNQITIPPKKVEIASKDVLRSIYESVPESNRLSIGNLAQDEGVRALLNGDRFFGKHIGVVGSTGSGKSCTVAKILQEGMRPSEAQETAGVLNNSHIIIFDLHGEYASAFPEARVVGVDQLSLPCWLMNSEELEEMFIESNEQNSHNQVSQFRNAVIENKRRHAGADALAEISYDTPIYFSLTEVISYLDNLNREMIGKEPGEDLPKLTDGTLVTDRTDCYFDGPLDFVPASRTNGSKSGSGPFNGEFSRFLMRLNGRINDGRLNFLLKPTKDGGDDYKTDDLVDLFSSISGYAEPETNVTIIDLSGIPFEVLSVVVSLVTRLVFTFAFSLKGLRAKDDPEVAFLLVYEEAHNYVPQSEGAKYRSVKKSIERIAKEGRKYGVSLMIVSQRPSEISETVFSQCSNFVAMRLTNPTDQRYVRRLLPDDLNAITGSLPSLEKREAILLGDAIGMPSLVMIDEIEHTPDSRDIPFHQEWKRDWYAVALEKVLKPA